MDDRLQYNELALEAMRWAAVKPATRDAVARVNRCVEEMQKLRGHTAPPVDRRGTLEALEKQRPHWAKGYSTDSIAAQVSGGALSELWELLGVSNQTDAVEKLQRLSVPDVSGLVSPPRRAEDLRKAYAARRDAIDPLTEAALHYLREQREPDLADLIVQHSIHLAPFDAIVYARIDTREVGVKYSAVGGDKAEAVRLAVREVLRLVGVTV